MFVCWRTYLAQCGRGWTSSPKVGWRFNWGEIGMDKKLENKGTILCSLMEPFNDPFHWNISEEIWEFFELYRDLWSFTELKGALPSFLDLKGALWSFTKALWSFTELKGALGSFLIKNRYVIHKVYIFFEIIISAPPRVIFFTWLAPLGDGQYFCSGPLRSGIPDLVRIRTKVPKMVRNRSGIGH